MIYYPGQKNIQRGFSLLEISIAIAIFGSIMGLTASAINGMINAREKILNISGRENEVKLASDLMISDFRNAFLFKPPSHIVEKQSVNMKTVFSSKGSFGRTEIHFTAFGNRRLFQNENSSDMLLVSYKMATLNDGETAIMRAERKFFEGIDTGQRFEDTEYLVLLTGVSEFSVEFYNKDGEDWISNWSSADIEKQNKLPERYRIRIKAKVNGAEKVYYAGGAIPLGGDAIEETKTFIDGL